MSKSKAAGMKHYEILFIVPNKFTDEEAKKVAAYVEKVLTENGGQVTYSEYWGKKRLAYEIKHNAFGYYGLFEFDLEGKNLAKIDNTLKLSTDVLRHLVVVKKAKTEEEIARNAAIKAKIDSKKASEKKAENKEEGAPAKAEKASKKASSDKADLKDLDEKLEGILNAEDLIK
jgi:small subunit ribosomal protein S6